MHLITHIRLFCLAAFTVALTPRLAEAQQFSFSNIADTTMLAPGHTAFTGFFPPSVSGSNVAFVANYSGGSGIYTGTVGATGATKIVDATDTAPGHTTFTGFGPAATVSGSNLAFGGTYSGGLGIYTGAVATVGAVKIVDTTDTAPGRTAFTDFDLAPSISGSNVSFLGSYSSGSGIYTGAVGTAGSVKIVDTTDTAPGHGAFTSFGGSTAVSGSNVAFHGNYSGGSGIYTGTVGATGATKIADTGNTAPGHTAFISFSGTSSVSGNNVAFSGSYSGGGGIYTGAVGTTGATKIVDTTDNAPGHTAFTSAGPPSASGSNVAFRGAYSGGSGLFLYDGGSPFALLNTGDALFGSTVSSLLVSPFGYDGNEVGFYYTLASGVKGVAVATVIPEPSTLALLLVSGGILAGRKRRGGGVRRKS